MMASIFVHGVFYILCLLIIPAHLFDCPDTIYPCYCDGYTGETNMFCEGLWSGEELRDLIHNSDFGNDYEFDGFEMRGSPLVKMIKNGTFMPLSFTRFNLNGYSNPVDNIEEIESGTFLGSESSVERIYASDMNLTVFPFGDLKSLTKLYQLRLENNSICFVGDLTSNSLTNIRLEMNSINEIPAISMGILESLNISVNVLNVLPDNVFMNVPALQTLDMSHNPLVSLPNFVFHNLTSVKEIYFNNGNLMEVQPDMWSNNTNLEEVRLNNNFISILPTGFFTPGSKNDLTLDLSNNDIESVQPGAFEAIRGMHIHLEYNNLAVLEEESWRYLLQNRVILHLYGNPFTCGCDVAWIVRDNFLFDSFGDEPTCTSGERITDLQEEDFVDC